MRRGFFASWRGKASEPVWDQTAGTYAWIQWSLICSIQIFVTFINRSIYVELYWKCPNLTSCQARVQGREGRMLTDLRMGFPSWRWKPLVRQSKNPIDSVDSFIEYLKNPTWPITSSLVISNEVLWLCPSQVFSQSSFSESHMASDASLESGRKKRFYR